MANGFYVPFKTRLLGGNANSLIDWDADTIKATLVDTGDYTVNLTTHDFFDDVVATPAAEVATATITCSISGAAVDATDWAWTAVTGDQSEAVVIWKNTGANATSPVAVYYDTSTGLPVTPNGADINVTVHASGLFAL
jgi:hypothetical protein